MAFDGRKHEKHLVCMWVRGFLRSAQAAGLNVDSTREGTVYIVTVNWLQAQHAYALDPKRQSIQRVITGDIRSLIPLDAEYDDSVFSVALRDALESRLGGTVDLYQDANSNPSWIRECERLVDAGDFD